MILELAADNCWWSKPKIHSPHDHLNPGLRSHLATVCRSYPSLCPISLSISSTPVYSGVQCSVQWCTVTGLYSLLSSVNIRSWPSEDVTTGALLSLRNFQGAVITTTLHQKIFLNKFYLLITKPQWILIVIPGYSTSWSNLIQLIRVKVNYDSLEIWLPLTTDKRVLRLWPASSQLCSVFSSHWPSVIISQLTQEWEDDASSEDCEMNNWYFVIVTDKL